MIRDYLYVYYIFYTDPKLVALVGASDVIV